MPILSKNKMHEIVPPTVLMATILLYSQ